MHDASSSPIRPVILSGGSGTRLWPWSRNDNPKQFIRLLADKSLLQATAARTTGPDFSPPVFVANARHMSEVTAQLTASDMSAEALICEPAGRNTAPAIALAALHAAATDPDMLLLVMPSDHLITDQDAFHKAIRHSVPAAQAGWLCTFGITPTYPETGYGYIETGTPIMDSVMHVVRFMEKPDAETAMRCVESGRYVWNSGIFLFRAGDLLRGLAQHTPDVLSATRTAIQHTSVDGIVVYPDAEAFKNSPSISIDYAVMERSDHVAVTPVQMGWSDIGSWDSLDQNLPQHARTGDVVAVDTENCLLHSQGPLIAAVGIRDLIVVAMDDAVMIAPKGSGQTIRQIVDALQKQSHPALDHSPRQHTQWGEIRRLTHSPAVTAEEVILLPGKGMPLTGEEDIQMTVLEGEALFNGQRLHAGTSANVTASTHNTQDAATIHNMSEANLRLLIIRRTPTQ